MADTPTPPRPDDFAEQAARPQRGRLRELLDFLLHSDKWWLKPVLIALLLVSLLIILGSTAAAPFIYTLF